MEAWGLGANKSLPYGFQRSFVPSALVPACIPARSTLTLTLTLSRRGRGDEDRGLLTPTPFCHSEPQLVGAKNLISLMADLNKPKRQNPNDN